MLSRSSMQWVGSKSPPIIIKKVILPLGAKTVWKSGEFLTLAAGKRGAGYYLALHLTGKSKRKNPSGNLFLETLLLLSMTRKELKYRRHHKLLLVLEHRTLVHDTELLPMELGCSLMLLSNQVLQVASTTGSELSQNQKHFDILCCLEQSNKINTNAMQPICSPILRTY